MKLIDLLETKTSKKLYRAISVMGDIIEYLNNEKFVGTSWSDDKSSARVYRDKHRGYGEMFILVSIVDENIIDFEKTKELNSKIVRGNFEREVRLKTNKKIKLNKVFDASGNKISMSGITLITR